MSFQHFRLGDISIHHSIPQQVPQTVTTTKQPYGSGDSDDGYTLSFPNLDAFQAWRISEEERNCVEFVKGDTHGSKADPPRFKDHTKLVCARHSRSGRKKYVKKHPERVRKVPSRKLEGVGCQASISYKTYFETEEVRVCYLSQHSHEIGPANLPFTRRGRKAAVVAEKSRKKALSEDPQAATTPMPQPNQPGPSTQIIAQPVPPPPPPQPVNAFSNAVSMLAPLPPQPFQPAQPQTYPAFAPAPPPPPPGPTIAYAPQQQQQAGPQDRWDNMATLFQAVRDHAKTHEYPPASVAALETVLIRLYLESPMGLPQSLPHRGQMPNGHQGDPGSSSGGNPS